LWINYSKYVILKHNKPYIKKKHFCLFKILIKNRRFYRNEMPSYKISWAMIFAGGAGGAFLGGVAEP